MRVKRDQISSLTYLLKTEEGTFMVIIKDEEFIRGTIEEIQEKITTPKGEYVIIIDENSDIDTNEENELNKLNNNINYHLSTLFIFYNPDWLRAENACDRR